MEQILHHLLMEISFSNLSIEELQAKKKQELSVLVHLGLDIELDSPEVYTWSRSSSMSSCSLVFHNKAYIRVDVFFLPWDPSPFLHHLGEYSDDFVPQAPNKQFSFLPGLSFKNIGDVATFLLQLQFAPLEIQEQNFAWTSSNQSEAISWFSLEFWAENGHLNFLFTQL